MTRHEHDKYYTATKVTTAFLKAYMPLTMPNIAENTSVIYEPCVGKGGMASAIKSCLPHTKIITNDLYPSNDWYPDMSFDAKEDTLYNFYSLYHAQWVITNPPYNQAMEILETAYDNVSVGVAMLLRLSFLEPTVQRRKFLKKHRPSAIFVLGSPRPDFREDGNTDSITTCWIVWDKSKLFRRGIYTLTNNSERW